MKTKDRSSHNELVQIISGLLIFAAVSVFAVALLYVWTYGTALMEDRAAWGQFGDYFGGTLNPILAFLSFIAIILTLSIQNKQLSISKQELSNSRAELEATREELKRTADSQAIAATALQSQVRFTIISSKISAISVALKATEDELERYKDTINTPGHTHQIKGVTLSRRREQLLAQLDSLSKELAGEA